MATSPTLLALGVGYKMKKRERVQGNFRMWRKGVHLSPTTQSE